MKLINNDNKNIWQLGKKYISIFGHDFRNIPKKKRGYPFPLQFIRTSDHPIIRSICTLDKIIYHRRTTWLNFLV